MRVHFWIVAVAVCLSLSQASFAQGSDWAVVSQLAPGQKVKVETVQGKSYAGTVQSVTDDAIQVGKGDLIPKSDVRLVQIWSPGHHGRNALIGLGVGAGFGIVAGVTCGRGSIVSRGQCIAVGAPFFGGMARASEHCCRRVATGGFVYQSQHTL
jgi:hypothetical protein